MTEVLLGEKGGVLERKLRFIIRPPFKKRSHVPVLLTLTSPPHFSYLLHYESNCHGSSKRARPPALLEYGIAICLAGLEGR